LLQEWDEVSFLVNFTAHYFPTCTGYKV